MKIRKILEIVTKFLSFISIGTCEHNKNGYVFNFGFFIKNIGIVRCKVNEIMKIRKILEIVTKFLSFISIGTCEHNKNGYVFIDGKI